jgi:hypothetical protein
LIFIDSRLKQHVGDGIEAIVIICRDFHIRENPAFTHRLGVELMNSAGASASERNLRLLEENRITALVFP